MEKRTPPPPKQNGQDIDWDAVVARLNTERGEYFHIGEFSPGVAHHIRVGRYPSFFPVGTDNPQSYIRKRYHVTTRSVTGSDPRRSELFIKRYLTDEGK